MARKSFTTFHGETVTITQQFERWTVLYRKLIDRAIQLRKEAGNRPHASVFWSNDIKGPDGKVSMPLDSIRAAANEMLGDKAQVPKELTSAVVEYLCHTDKAYRSQWTKPGKRGTRNLIVRRGGGSGRVGGMEGFAGIVLDD